MTKQTAIHLPDDIYARLSTLSAQTGRTKTYYIREALDAHLEDLEDYYLAERAAAEHRRDGSPVLTLDELDAELALEG